MHINLLRIRPLFLVSIGKWVKIVENCTKYSILRPTCWPHATRRRLVYVGACRVW